MALFTESGGTAEDRNQEAFDILVKMDLQNQVDAMNEKEAAFVVSLADRMTQFGEKCQISPKQLFWLRDLKEKYL